MLIHCTDNCRHQQYGYCTLKDTYSGSDNEAPKSKVMTANCIYIEERHKGQTPGQLTPSVQA